MRDVSATVIEVHKENVINIRSVWTAWFQFRCKQHLLCIDVLFFHNILNEQHSSAASSGFNWINYEKHRHGISSATDKAAWRTHNIRMWIFILNSTNIRNWFFFDSPSKNVSTDWAVCNYVVGEELCCDIREHVDVAMEMNMSRS